MKAKITISKKGDPVLHIISEGEIEGYMLNAWYRKNAIPEHGSISTESMLLVMGSTNEKSVDRRVKYE